MKQVTLPDYWGYGQVHGLDNVDFQYLNHMNTLLNEGALKQNRTGVTTYSLFGHQMRFNLTEAFPLLSSKKVHLKSIIHEVLWFLQGNTNIKYLRDNDVTIWDEWADENGDLGPVYGYQWRHWDDFSPGAQFKVDQLQKAIDTLKTNPDDRRIIVSAWNPVTIDRMALPPCHCFFQFYSHISPLNGKRLLSCHMYQRSADWFLGVPFNIASYSLLTMMVAQVVGMEPYEFIHSFGDTHLYENHLEQAKRQIRRGAVPTLPQLTIKDRGQTIDDFVYEDFELHNYIPHAGIKAEVAV